MRGEPHAERTPAPGRFKLRPLPALQTEAAYRQGKAVGGVMFLCVLKNVAVPIALPTAVMR